MSNVSPLVISWGQRFTVRQGLTDSYFHARVTADNASFEPMELRGRGLRITAKEWKIATWNIEGLNDVKEEELQRIMKKCGLGVLCLQETHLLKSGYWITAAGYLIINSGSSAGHRGHAGVGFKVAPCVRRCVISFLQQSNRAACLKTRVPGGKMCILPAYAPHSGRPYDERQKFFQDLQVLYNAVSSNGPKLIFVDFNARLHLQLPGEESVIGPHVFGDKQANLQHFSNRFLLLEFCIACGLAVANTFLSNPAEKQITC